MESYKIFWQIEKRHKPIKLDFNSFTGTPMESTVLKVCKNIFVAYTGDFD